jgi:hypothetical protein
MEFDFLGVQMTSLVNFIHKVPKALRKCLSKWINVTISKTAHRIFFLFSILIYLFEYETIIRSSASSFGHSDPDPNSVS